MRTLHIIGEDGALVNNDAMTEFFETSLSHKTCDDAVLPLAPAVWKKLVQVKRCGTKYHVVGVFGGQSSGKSTLLNNLFDTSFETMGDDTGRHQTTKGAFLARYVPQKADTGSAHADPAVENDAGHFAGSSSLFVMDFEGTDGMERGEDQSFERHLSLFALSVADVLVINMWANDVGRYNAANMSLLRTIFEVNLQLFNHELYAKDEKPTLLIVLRDFTETDLEKYSDIVMKSLSKIWESITKPTGFESSEITTLFHVRFQGLPHYKLQREAFDKSIVDFRRWFNDPLSPKYLFNSTVSYRGIPLEVLPPYFESCWASIQASKDLDIPSQRDLVAQHKCSELHDESMSSFKSTIADMAAHVKGGELLPHLETTLHHAADMLVAEFSSQTKLYTRRVVAEFVAKIRAATESSMSELVALQTSKLVETCMRNLDEEIQILVDDAVQQLLSSKDLLGGRATAADSHKYVKSFWGHVVAGVAAVEERIASGADLSCFGRFKGLVEDDGVARERTLVVIQEKLREKVRARIAAMASDACSSMTKAFDYVLAHKEDGTVRFFATSKGLENAYPAARLAGLYLLACIFYTRLSATENADQSRFYLHLPTFEDSDTVVKYPDFTTQVLQSAIKPQRTTDASESDEDDASAESTLATVSSASTLRRGASTLHGFTEIDPIDIVMSKAAVRRAFDLFSQQIQFSMQMQLRTIESSQQNIPAWVWAVMLVLGHNELIFVVTSPVLLLFVIFVAYFFFSSWIIAQWHRFEETGPKSVVLAVKAAFVVAEPLVKHLKSSTTHPSPTEEKEKKQ